MFNISLIKSVEFHELEWLPGAIMARWIVGYGSRCVSHLSQGKCEAHRFKSDFLT